jgi:hypothetical protein
MPLTTPQIVVVRSVKEGEDPAAAILAVVRVVSTDGSGGGRVDERMERSCCR